VASVASLDLCPGFEIVVNRVRGGIKTPETGPVQSRQRNERALRKLRVTWPNPTRGTFAQVLGVFREASGTTMPVSITLPGGEVVDACFDGPPRRTHGNAGKGRVEADLTEDR
jgi:hypothetical protein